MSRIVICRGISGCGKTTFARELVSLGYKRVNKDDLRVMFDSSEYSRENEVFIYLARKQLISLALRNGHDVVVDDTNCQAKDVKEIAKLARKVQPTVDVRVATFTTPFEVCVERNSKREGKVKVPVEALQRQHKLLQSNPECKELSMEGFPRE